MKNKTSTESRRQSLSNDIEILEAYAASVSSIGITPLNDFEADLIARDAVLNVKTAVLVLKSKIEMLKIKLSKL